MTDSTGYLQGDKLWHIYRYPQKPDTLMVLGSILTEPFNLESSLNFGTGIEPFPEKCIMDQTQAVKLFVRSEFSKSNGGRLKAALPFSPIASAKAGLGATSSSTSEAIIDALGIRAISVMPDTAKEYLEKALEQSTVVEFTRKGMFSQPLYMIVGVASCKNLYMGHTANKERSGAFDFDVGLAPAGLEAGAGISRDKGASADSEREVAEECDFAYRVREFQYSRWKRRMKKSSDVTEGAMYGAKHQTTETSAVDGDFEEVPVFEYFEDQDEDEGIAV